MLVAGVQQGVPAIRLGWVKQLLHNNFLIQLESCSLLLPLGSVPSIATGHVVELHLWDWL